MGAREELVSLVGGRVGTKYVDGKHLPVCDCKVRKKEENR